jgi:hypothetical protein
MSEILKNVLDDRRIYQAIDEANRMVVADVIVVYGVDAFTDDLHHEITQKYLRAGVIQALQKVGVLDEDGLPVPGQEEVASLYGFI